MARKGNEVARMLRELLETAEELAPGGVLTKPEFARIRILCAEPPDYPPERVASIRINMAGMSQSVFAALLNVSLSTVQKWESPVANKRPSGAAAKLLQLLEQKGVETLMTKDKRA